MSSKPNVMDMYDFNSHTREGVTVTEENDVKSVIISTHTPVRV